MLLIISGQLVCCMEHTGIYAICKLKSQVAYNAAKTTALMRNALLSMPSATGCDCGNLPDLFYKN